ncbi:MAG TPA: hypothetical protein VGK73_37735 [Polyangiaceae bacterium]
MQPLLVLDGARIESGGARSELALSGGEQRLALLGNFRPLFRLLSGEARLVAGRVELDGVNAREAVRNGRAGLALLDPPVVPRWTVERCLFESARLAGFSGPDARRAAEASLAYFEIGGLRRARVDSLFLPVRRALVLAQATLTAPAVLCAEAPLSELDPEGQAYVAVALERAAYGRRLLASVATSLPQGLERAHVERADWVVVEQGGSIKTQGPAFRPGPQRYFATVMRSGSGFLAALTERGFSARATPHAPDMPGLLAPHGEGSLRVVVELPASATANDVVRAAHAAGAPLVELTGV